MRGDLDHLICLLRKGRGSTFVSAENLLHPLELDGLHLYEGLLLAPDLTQQNGVFHCVLHALLLVEA